MTQLAWRVRSLALLLAVPVAASAQQAPDTARAPRVVTPQLDFSGAIFGNYQYQTDSSAKAKVGGKNPNQFTIERVYLTFRMPVGEHASIRATTDIFQGDQSGSSYYRGWTVRLKYGYLQYDFARDIGDMKGFNATARVGMLNTVVVDHVEGYWPRYLSQVPTDRNGYFSSSDLGVAGLLSLPKKWGELYGTITNGPGYTAGETDRFKDFALRLSLTPFASLDAAGGYLKTFVVSPWVSKGFNASRFASGGTGQVGPVPDGLTKDRWGVFAGTKDRRLTLGGEYDHRTDEAEGAAGLNTPTSPRVVAETNGTILSGFAIARPLEWADATRRSSFGVLGRIDQVKPNTGSRSSTFNTSSSYDRLIIAGFFWEPTSRSTLAVDYQWRSPQSGSTNVEQQTWYLHWQASF